MKNNSLQVKVTTRKDIESFEVGEWGEEDLVHYGRPVSWDSWEPEWHHFKAIADGEVVGALVAYHLGGVLFLNRIIVRKDKRRQQIGQQLLQSVEEFARGHQLHKIQLETGRDWLSNKFYERNGYKITGELPQHFYGKDFVVYTKLI